MGRLRNLDPVAIARAYLLAHPDVQEALGGDDRIGARNEPPYPCVVLSDPPGDDRTLRHLIAPLLQIEVYGDLDGTPGKPVLRGIMYDILEALAALPEQPTVPGQPVVTSVAPSGGGGYVPDPTGQPRYIATVRMHMHPAHPSGTYQ